MKVKRTKEKTKKRILLLDKQKMVNERYKRNKEAEDLKYKSSDFKVVSLSGVSFSEVVKEEKEEIKKRKKQNRKRILFAFLFSIVLILFVIYILIRFKFINVNKYFKGLNNKVNTSFLYNDTNEEILNVLFEYKKESYVEYIENNFSFEYDVKEKNENEETKEKRKQKNENNKKIENKNQKQSKVLKLIDKYKEVLENTKLEYRKKEKDNLKYKEEINIWSYNQPVKTNTFVVNEKDLSYDSFILKKKMRTDINSFREYFYEYYIFDYIIDSLKKIDEDMDLGKNKLVLSLIEKNGNENNKENNNKNNSENNKEKNNEKSNESQYKKPKAKIDYSTLTYDRKLNAFKKLITNPKIKEQIFKLVELERKDEYIKINIDLNNEEAILNILKSIKEDEGLKKDLAEYIYISLNRMPRYLIKEVSKNEVIKNINNILDYESKQELLENIKEIKKLSIKYYTNSYSSINKIKNKISKIEYIFNLEDNAKYGFKSFKIIKDYSYQENKDIKESLKNEELLRTKDEIRKAEEKLVDENEVELNKNLKVYSKLKELEENYEDKNSKAVQDAVNIRNINIVMPSLKKINQILDTKIKKGIDFSKINIQQEVKEILYSEMNGLENNNKSNKKNIDEKLQKEKILENIDFKADIDANLENIIYTKVILKINGKTYNIKTKLTKENLLDLNNINLI